MDQIDTRLETARQELLDLGLRNPLINYRPLKARSLEIVQERPSTLLPLLVENGVVFTFLPQPEAAPDEPGTPGQPGTDPLTDNQLQTPYNSAELQKRLLNSYYTAVAAIEEQGVNILYLALGLLRWRETPNAEVARRAPLLLIPVALNRDSADSRFTLAYTGAEIQDNPSLRLKLAADFGLTLPELPSTDVPDVAAYFAQVAQIVAGMSGWRVEETAVHLGFFSFSKLLMVADLDAANWPAGRRPADHPVLQSLLHPDGFSESGGIPDNAFLDDLLPLDNSFQVVDADSSQMQAILDVRNGRHLVIQGPPGTGKSQTITNLIAEALGQGKTVLFVAEKMAALEVVKRRLDEIGLGDAALELHSHKTTKRGFLAELVRTVQRGQPKVEGRLQDGRFPALDELTQLRHRLNNYSRALNEPIGESGVTLYHAYGRALQLRARLADHAPLPALNQAAMQNWSQQTYRARLAQLTALQTCLQQMGVPAAHPLAGSRLAEFNEATIPLIRQHSQDALHALARLTEAAANLARHLGTAVPLSPAALDKLLFDAHQLLVAPTLYAVDVQAAAWREQAEPLLAALEAGQQTARAHAEFDTWLIPEAWAQEVLPIRQGLMAGPKRWRSLSGRYRAARQQLAGLCRRAMPDEWEQQVALVDAILDVQRVRPLLAQMTPLLAQLFSVRWQKEESDWADLLRVGRWLVGMHREIETGQVDPALLAYAAQGVHGDWLRAAIAGIEAAKGERGTAVAHLFACLQWDETLRLGPNQSFAAAPFAEQQHILAQINAAADRLPEMAAYNRAANEWHTAGLPDVAEVAYGWPAGPAHLTNLFNLAWFTSLIEKAAATHPQLHGASSAAQDEAVRRFQELDREFLAANRLRLADAHWQRLPRYTAVGQMGRLQTEMGKQRAHKPIRTLMQEAGTAVQRIKPLFMMSPLSIATFLPPDSVSFDLVIFDEASQVRPVDAFGAILRGRQVVIVGDGRQLPPTSFFERVVGEEIARLGDWEIDEASDPPITQLPNYPITSPESILDLFCTQHAPQRLLRWHYRSRHESLIAISNRAFYERQLVIFPSPDAGRQEVGLRLHVHRHTVYDRGRSRTNPAEAQLVAEAVMAHARAQLAADAPLSLGVVAFSASQSEAVRNAVEQLRRADPSLEPFFAANHSEPFFVKNLENVQGDERDVILISMGYGRAADGSLSLNFGPLNLPGGERRLNVLISRARQRCEIFTNFAPDDLDADRVEARSIAILKDYLQYAQTGQLPMLAPDQASQVAPFEEVVAAVLRAQGYGVAQRVGDGPVRVDLALRDEARPGYYRLGLECDGDNYHLARSARDRDRIQAEVLAQLGWRVGRVWSHAWWHDPAGEQARLLAMVEDGERTAVPPAAPMPVLRYEVGKTAVAPRPIPDYQMAQISLPASKASFHRRYREYASFREEVLRQLEMVVTAESPIHMMEAMRRLWLAAGYKVVTANEGIAGQMVESLTANGRIRRRGDFLWSVMMTRPLVRNRAHLPTPSRKFELIAPEEVEEAVLLVVRDAVCVGREEIPLAVGRLFGFRQVSERAETAVQAAVERLVRWGRVTAVVTAVGEQLSTVVDLLQQNS
jgi:DNA polymerase III delta prime subunit/very-short-patch-repair endonuclease